MSNERRVSLAVSVLLVLAVVTVVGQPAMSQAKDNQKEPSVSNSDRIQPYAENPRYWQYNGKPVLLIGGSKDDNLFQIPELEKHLNLLASVGGNYIRNTMSARIIAGYEVQAFKKLPNGKYDLNQWNDEYWNRFATLLKLTSEREIIIQIEVWDRFDYTDCGRFESWNNSPYNPANNINYTSEESGLATTYPKHHPGKNKQPFFHTVPKMDDNIVLRKYQEAFVDKMLSHSLRYGNVLYCMDNETSESAEWGSYWSNYIKKKAAEAGVEVHTTEMWSEYDLLHELHKRTYDHPETYSFCDISQNNHNRGQKHWDNIEKVRAYLALVRPINSVKIYGSDEPYRIAPPGARDGIGGRYGWDRDGLERFWRQIFGSMASSRFHRPPSGLGLNHAAQTNIRSMRLLVDEMDIFTCAPHNDLLSDRKDNEAYCVAEPGKQYAVYFPDGGEVALDIGLLKEPATIRWLEISTSKWEKRQELKPAMSVTPTPAGAGPVGGFHSSITRLVTPKGYSSHTQQPRAERMRRRA